MSWYSCKPLYHLPAIVGTKLVPIYNSSSLKRNKYSTKGESE